MPYLCPKLLLLWLASASLAAAQAPAPPEPQSSQIMCYVSPEEAQAGSKLSDFCTQLEEPDTWGLLREESITYNKRGLIDSTLLEQTRAEGSDEASAYKILLWPPDVPHEYASEEPLLVLEPELDPGSTLDPSGPQFLRLVPGQLLVYVPLLGAQPSLLYRVDLHTHLLLQTTTFPACPATETCQSQALFLMARANSRTRWLLHTWRFDTEAESEVKVKSKDTHETTTMLWDGQSIVPKTPPLKLLGPTWIEFTLKDEFGRPSVRERYVASLHRPAGWAIEGCLDAEGNARPEDLFKQIVDLYYPELDRRDWHVTHPPRKRTKSASKRRAR